jgi:hypothetical protein
MGRTSDPLVPRRPQPGRRRCRRGTGPRLLAIRGLSRRRLAAVLIAAAVWSRVSTGPATRLGPAARRLRPRRPGRARSSGHRAPRSLVPDRQRRSDSHLPALQDFTSAEAGDRNAVVRRRARFHADRDVLFVAGLACFLALSARRVRGGPNMGAWPITQSAGAPRSRRSRCAKCGRTVMAPSRSRGTGGRVALPGPGAGYWSTRGPGTSRAWFRRESSHTGSGRWTCSPMCPVFPPIWDGYRA